MKNALKSFSVEEIESAIEASITALTGGKCAVSISSLEFQGFVPELPPPDIADLSIKITIKSSIPKKATSSGDPTPF